LNRSTFWSTLRAPSSQSFTDYTAEDFGTLSSTNLEAFLYVTQGVVKQTLAQKSGGTVVSRSIQTEHSHAHSNDSVETLCSVTPVLSVYLRWDQEVDEISAADGRGASVAACSPQW
jgi:hypothetical protein